LENGLTKYVGREEKAPIYHFVTIYEILIINNALKTYLKRNSDGARKHKSISTLQQLPF